jgi:hypothetical protein
MRSTLRVPARLLVCAALAGSAALAAVAIPGGIAAASPLAVSCTHLSGSATSQHVYGCTGTGAIAADAGPSTGIYDGVHGAYGTNVVSTKTITWSNGKTSKTTYTYTSVTNNCPAVSGYTKFLKEHETGHVNTGTAGGTAVGMRGGTFGGYACVYELTTHHATILVKNDGNLTV